MSAVSSANDPQRPILVGVSGGVDSAVTLLRLQADGAAPGGYFIKSWDGDDTAGYCGAAEDLAAARAVCEHLELPLFKGDFSAVYQEHVFAPFLAEYRAGRTPNPDILCNREVKFGAFLDHALAIGADAIATGHYARRLERDGQHLLARATDENKDQTYFLHRLDQRQLRHARFPLGALTKDQVRALARDAGLPNHARKDSTGICFIGERPFADFLCEYLPPEPGEIVTDAGDVIGTHPGVHFFTLGQRGGLGLGGVAGYDDRPWYVIAKDPERRRVIVGQGPDHPALFADTVEVADLHWIAGEPPEPSVLADCEARIRHRQPLQPCRLTPLDNGRWQVTFQTPQRAPAPGQSAVFYAGEICLGGGPIHQVETHYDGP